MVDGLSNSGNNQNFIKLKGTNQKIDLSKLEGLRKTEQNQAWFDRADINKNGVIDAEEVESAKGFLATIANGNNKLSKKEAKKQGLDFNSITSLAKQQEDLEKNGSYTEKNKDVTTTVTKDGTTYTYANGDTKTVKSDGTTVIQYHEGTKQINDGKGNITEINADGSIIKKNNGKTVSVTDADGNITTYTSDGNKSITKDSDGNLIKTLELKNNEEVRTEYEYKDGQQIAREYTGSGNDAELTSITVKTQENGHVQDLVYNNEEDYKNNRPSKKILDSNNDILKNVTEYTYEENGNIKEETTDSSGNKTVKYKNSNGEEIPSNSVESNNYEVQKGEGITAIVTKALKEQGFSDEDLKKNPEILKNAKSEFLEANADKVKTYNGAKAEWKGNKYFLVGEKVTIPNFSISAGSLDEVVVTAKQPSKEAIEVRAKLQELFGDQYDVGYSKDGKLEVRDKKGNVLQKATEKANSYLPATSQQKTQEAAENNEEADAVLSTYDTIEKDNKLNKEEFKNYIIENLEIEITDANRDKIEQIINNGFASIDTIETDGKITKEELLSEASQKTMEQIQNKIDEMEVEQQDD